MPVPLHGQVAVTGSAQALSATPVKAAAFSIDAPASNNQPVYVGSSSVTTGNGYAIYPGDGMDYERNDQSAHVKYILSVSDFYVVGTSGDTVSWFATPTQT